MDVKLFCSIVAAANVALATIVALRPWRLPRARREGGRIEIYFRDLLLAMLVFAVVALVEAIPRRPLGLTAFGLIRLIYLDLVVCIPAIGGLILLAHATRAWRARPSAIIIAALALLPAPIGYWATFIEPFRIKLETPTLTLSAARAGREPITLGILADIQTERVGPHEHAGIELLMQQRPDIIIIPGDLWQGWQMKDEAQSMRNLLARLSAPGGVYLSPGNLEWWYDPSPFLEGTNVRLLRNAIVRVKVRDRNVTIAGIDDDNRERRDRTIRQLESAAGEDDVRILSGHLPDTVKLLETNTRVDLLVSGHTHGGQVVLPFYGPVMTLSRVPRKVAAGGLHELNGRHIYVSRGLGHEGGQAPRIRMFCPPEVTLLTFK